MSIPGELLTTFEARIRNAVAWLALGLPVYQIVGKQPLELTLAVQ
jgi:hypothetical protein